MPSSKPSICFVAPNNYAVLSAREDLEHIGGAEVQRMLIARELAARGYEVSFVTLDHGQEDGITHNGLRVWKMCGRDVGLPGLRFFHPRWTSLNRAMKRANADIYIQRTAGVETGQVALWCRRKGKRFILSIANDPECDQRLGGKGWRVRHFFHYGLKHADRVIAQTNRQRDMLAKNFGIDATVIRSCAPDPGTAKKSTAPSSPAHILWVGRFSPQKRIDRLLEAVQALPEFEFDVIGGGGSEDLQPIIKRLAALPNVKMHGFIPYPQMDVHYRQASLLLSTSAWEGYPNTFMEAWSRGIPVVSTIDPDDVIAKYNLGMAVTNPAKLPPAIHRVAADQTIGGALSKNARKFFEENHTIARTVDAWEEIIQK